MHATQRCVSSVTAKDLLMLCMLAQAARYGEFHAGDHSSCTPVLHHTVRTSRSKMANVEAVSRVCQH